MQAMTGKQYLANEVALSKLNMADLLDELASLRERLARAEKALAERDPAPSEEGVNAS